ncbi:MAG: hypothetical protein BGO31_20770 [Bacteroidetes bacterium 43-16]|nr:DUF6520 family protein [uncultured Dysgonomonas sp.]OJV55365.1 MAG: hypothetical protein BGO31_20770 [Bacteroidetes bacterium 43-16]
MRKLIFSAAALMLATAFSFAGTPETKGEAKPEVKTETTNLVYHYTGKDAQGRIIFEEGEATEDCGQPGSLPCEWESASPMSSPQTAAYINTNATLVNSTRQ